MTPIEPKPGIPRAPTRGGQARRVARFPDAAGRRALDRDLRQALDRGEVTVAYQPQVDLESGRVVGVEALARWRHPALGAVAPAVFVPLAERRGLIRLLTDQVLASACRDVAGLRARGHALRVAVNLSAGEIAGSDLPARVGRCLAATGLEPEALDVEVTEGTLVRDVASSAAVLAELRRSGVHIAVDDFGTGYSSLAFVRRFPLDILKIDRAFIESIDGDGGDGGAIARLLVDLGRTLGARVIAEGVETDGQVAWLRQARVDEAQGYVFAPPLELAELEAFLSRG